MRAKGGSVLWFLAGGIAGFSFLDLVGFGALTLMPSIGFGLLLLMLRVPGIWMWLVGAGTVGAALWGSLIIDPNAPDDELWPLLLGL
ncbi:MAG: hypothetical protein ACRDLB_05970, partial [Actinomycetota bacterium]